jgi:HEAT repeat protein
MKPLELLVQDLDSSIASIRDQAALALMELGSDAAILPLLSAIARPENANNRGTLVYALGAFDCRNHVETLVDLALTGNFEVATGAFQIIADFEASPLIDQKIRHQLSKHDLPQLSFEHSHDAHAALVELVSRQQA